ncbi:putative Deoxyribodipyrimidine photo-lyase [Myriangium duriaei CBS 260.36]|uniref:Deoxyribodipyrimidine photo-lyase n=1 Tax=Myriangium duriaei CBS 260.36 TaxID=1168546 RepID=A0A9P4J3F7_9PEZI|nr:putative Deoxyribodipyrimidine photo-lyase [Myriangium duriaei CBS 260.36]
MAFKRKLSSEPRDIPADKKPVRAPKRIKEEDEDSKFILEKLEGPKGHAQDGIGSGYPFYQPEFYPKEMSNQRCRDYIDGKIPKPIEVLRKTQESTADKRAAIEVGKSVIHWYKRDLRTLDNRSLAAASAKAKSKGVPLICVFIVSPQDYQAHFTSKLRVGFEFRTLEILRADLAEKNIPLYVETVENRKTVPSRLLELCQAWGANHIYCNMEYEVDELRREEKLTRMGLEKGIALDVLHDDVCIAPGRLATGAGKQFSVYSPWYRAWCAHLNAHPYLLAESPQPETNPDSARKDFKDIFDMKFPPIPENKRLDKDEERRFAKFWPAGEHEAMDRLDKFLSARITKYKDNRNFPSQESTGKLSAHFSAGTLAARTAVRLAMERGGTKKVDGGNDGVKGWISEVAWRDFYKHVMAWWPFVCMYKPFKFETSDIKWEFDPALWDKWVNGTTGFPIVDAAIRQMREMGWMHNRCRMIVASFLTKDLLIDWRHGERYFMEHLIDGDFASNNGGWGFSASTGVDPQPYFRIFNPLLQSEKFDAEGEYIRKWVKELSGIKGKAIHDPYGRGAAKEAERAGYPQPCVVHSERRVKALAMYKGE